MSSKKAAKAAKAAKRSAKLVDAAQAGDVETMARVMSSGGKLDLDALVASEGWINESTKEEPTVAEDGEAMTRWLCDCEWLVGPSCRSRSLLYWFECAPFLTF